MTWTKEDPTAATWRQQDAYDTNTFLLMESGERILQESGGRILLENTTGLWTENNPNSASWNIVNPH